MRLFSKRNLKHQVANLASRLDSLEGQLNQLILAHAAADRRRVRSLPPGSPLSESEFKVYSQFGEDGIIQFLTAHVSIPHKSFVEFGVEDFREANCRYLLEVEPWRGLVLDGDPEFERKIKGQSISFYRNLKPRCAFITAENINDILMQEGFVGDIGLLSIDIDGNDYWVWKAICVASPRIVIIEYNSVFGAQRAVTIPYDPKFNRRTAHFSWLYAGASLSALVHLGNQKGYSFVGSNSAGNNAFFVRNDILGALKPLKVEEGFVESTFRESRDPDGNMTFLNGVARLQLIEDMPLIDVISCNTIKAGQLITSSV